MNPTHRHISYRLMPLLCAAMLLQGCGEDPLAEPGLDRQDLIRQGKYLSARSSGENLFGIGLPGYNEWDWFPDGTPYRLLAFTKPDKGINADNAAEKADHPRFNKVAWEGSAGDLHYINVDEDPDRWFGFSPLGDEESGPGGQVALDFYGFTYGVEAPHTTNYIELDGLSQETVPAHGALPTLTRTETVTDGRLADLLRGELLNRSSATVSAEDATDPSIMSFTHCFSKLHILMTQQAADDGVTPKFPGVYIDRVDMTGTYMQGSVYLSDGKIKLPAKDADGNANRGNRTLEIINRSAVPVTQIGIGEMIIFPSAGTAIATGSDDNITEAGYTVGMDITLKCLDKSVIDGFLAKEGSSEPAVQKDDKYWYGVIRKTEIINAYTNETLYFKPNSLYTLLISLQEDIVRIITVIPQVEEWLDGEGTEERPWQDQAFGRPQMVDNLIWTDRNLGADHYHPTLAFEQTIGYFYQPGRNIPYFPFDTRQYAHDGSSSDAPVPTPDDKRLWPLDQDSSWPGTVYRLYPMVDPRILNMMNQRTGAVSNGSNSSGLWSMSRGEGNDPQMYIPESRPADHYFDFVQGNLEAGLYDNQNMYWQDGPQNQPISGAWCVPSSRDFMSLFPTTPYAGNITFRKGHDTDNAMGWSGHGTMDAKYKTLRVTVPYYDKTQTDEPTGKSPMYLQAWRTLRDNNDAGTTHLEAYYNYIVTPEDKTQPSYTVKTGPYSYTAAPDGDPEDGYASVYVISRDEGNTRSLPDAIRNITDKKGNQKFATKEWGMIYAIKRVYTTQAYRLRLRVLNDTTIATHGDNPGLFVEINRYRCSSTDSLTETNYKNYDWEHPAATLYFPICGLGDWTGAYINFGTECQYATRDPIENYRTSAVQIKVTGSDDYNQYIAVIKGQINRNFGMQIRPVGARESQMQ